MKDEYDFSKAKRGAVVQQKNKIRITIYLDDFIIDEFRNRADKVGRGYQTMINEALKEFLYKSSEGLSEENMRRILREELKKDRHERIMQTPSTATSSDWQTNFSLSVINDKDEKVVN